MMDKEKSNTEPDRSKLGELYPTPKTYDELQQERDEARAIRRARMPKYPKVVAAGIAAALIGGFLPVAYYAGTLLVSGIAGVSLSFLLAIIYVCLAYFGTKKIRDLLDVAD